MGRNPGCRLLSFATVLGILTLAASRPTAFQQGTPSEPRFEVASIKLNKAGPLFDPREHPPYQPGGRFTVSYVTLRSLISNAFRLEVVGGPAWIDTESYDINASAAREASVDEMRAMLRTMLRERFQLRSHIDARPKQGLTLTVIRADGQLGPRLRRSAAKCPTLAEQLATPVAAPAPSDSFRTATDQACGLVSVWSGRVTVRGMGLPQIAKLALTQPAGLPVVDQTGLTGSFDADLEWTRDAGNAAAPSDETTFVTAVRERLGLKLASGRVLQDVVVIDAVQRRRED